MVLHTSSFYLHEVNFGNISHTQTRHQDQRKEKKRQQRLVILFPKEQNECKTALQTPPTVESERSEHVPLCRNSSAAHRVGAIS